LVSSSVCFLHLTRNKIYVSFFLLKGKLFYGVKKPTSSREKKNARKREKIKRRKGSLRAVHFPNTTRNPWLRLSLTNHGRARRTESRRNKKKKGVSGVPMDLFATLCLFLFRLSIYYRVLFIWHIIQRAYNNTHQYVWPHVVI